MSTTTRPQALPQISLLMTLSVQTRAVCKLAQTPLGDRAVFEVSGGAFSGPQLRGRILPAGGDWLIRSGTRALLDVRLVLETEDGVNLLCQYSGCGAPRDGAPRVEVGARFIAPAGAYDWLNEIQAFGLGQATSEGVRYHLYRFE